MTPNHLEIPCPSWLEDECFIIETSGEMPEVAMQETLLNLPPLDPGQTDCLRAAVVLGYLRIIRRDLEYANLGQPHFRGLERAAQNLARLRAFLGRLGWELPPVTREELGALLRAYLAAEDERLRDGRPYASATAEAADALLGDLDLDASPWRELFKRLAALPVPDFRGLVALKRLTVPGAAGKRREDLGEALVIAVLGAQPGTTLAQATLPLLGLDQRPDPAAVARAELVWSLLALPAV